ncbi:MAG: ATP-binding protein, partial [Acidimicrobiia bacterium]|nr:ATP-binding protein [Acidimicrobiia bacterium]
MAAPTRAERTVRLPQDTSAARCARRMLREVAEVVGRDDRVEDFEVIVSELVTNAVDHGEPPIELRVVIDGGYRVEVTDCSPNQPRLVRAEPQRRRGRGVLLVD